jgi:hypothetical protein
MRIASKLIRVMPAMMTTVVTVSLTVTECQMAGLARQTTNPARRRRREGRESKARAKGKERKDDASRRWDRPTKRKLRYVQCFFFLQYRA